MNAKNLFLSLLLVVAGTLTVGDALVGADAAQGDADALTHLQADRAAASSATCTNQSDTMPAETRRPRTVSSVTRAAADSPGTP